LPVAEEQAPESDSASESAAESAAAQASLPPQKCRLLLVDDHRVVREGLTRLFESEPDIEVCGQAADGLEAIEKATVLKPDVVIMDVNLGPGIDGLEATRRIVARDPSAKIIGLSMHDDEEVARAMREAGAAAYRTKGAPIEDLISAVLACRRAS
jgi:DNA-binding NarL/FixJ family response regulator